MVGEIRDIAPSTAAPTLDCITLPWEVPSGTIIVEYGYGRWRVVTRDRAVATFASRDAALAHARQIAVLFIPLWKIVEVDPPASDAVAC